jgi:hypothetical protein
MNCLLKHVTEGKLEETRNEEEGVSSYSMSLRKQEDAGN